MGKIGIISFHRAVNYGAVLQVYALNESIKKFGYEPITIDYRNQYIQYAYDLNPLHSSDWKGFIIRILTYNSRKKKGKKFEEFREKYIDLDKITNLYYKEMNYYDKFITGSDQVWNFAQTQFDKTFFLNFVSVSKKKNSYGASFGFEHIPNQYLDDYKELLADFNHISVREEQGAHIIKNLLNRTAEVVLDPTMLLSQKDWTNISQDYTGKKDYILIYPMATSRSLLDFAVNLSKKTNCEIICVSSALGKRIKATYAAAVGPQEFLALFENARYVVTNSFHGTAFSINFNKLFFTEMLPSPAGVNSRLENILDIFDLRSRQIVDGKNGNVFDEIDYIKVNEKLESERQRSLDFLKRILEE